MKYGIASLLLVSVSVACASIACSGETLDVGSTGKGGNALGSDPSSTSTSTPTPPASAPPYSASDLAAAQARCDLDHGPAYAPTTFGAFRDRLLATSWYRCDGTGTAWTANGTGIEFVKTSADGFSGHFYALDKDPTGNFVQLQGLDGEGDWIFNAATASTVTTWTDDTMFGQIWVTIPGCALDSPCEHVVEFETSPLRMRVDHSQWYVGIGAGAD